MLLHSRFSVAAARRARVEIIPLIDVIFFLLATFVLFTLNMNKAQTLPVVLPRGDIDKEQSDVVTIQVSADGVIYWNREMIEAAEVRARLDHYKSQTDNPRIVISGEERARFGSTIAVFDQVRQAGISKVSIETRPRPAGK